MPKINTIGFVRSLFRNKKFMLNEMTPAKCFKISSSCTFFLINLSKIINLTEQVTFKIKQTLRFPYNVFSVFSIFHHGKYPITKRCQNIAKLILL